MKISVKPDNQAAYWLLHEGAQALAKTTANGIAIDYDYCKKKHKHLARQIERKRDKMASTNLVEAWQDKYGDKMNWDSSDQLADILYNELGHEPKVFTANGNPSTNQDALEALQIPEVEQLIEIDRLSKARNTFLNSIIRESVYHDDEYFIHPSFALNTVQTFRSSSFDPNFQNFPKRVKAIMNIIRRAMIPRKGRRLGEIDFSGAEIRGAYCYHMDPAMREEILNPERDMHRDMAMECYKLSLEEMGEKGSDIYSSLRYCGKNGFVFPEFYGDYFRSIAENMWSMVHLNNLVTAQGIPLDKHLASHGIKSQMAFEKHVEKVEDRFWNKRFPQYAKWRRQWLKAYERRGYFCSLTGFTFRGPMSKNQVINYPVQGASFHMLLWSLIRLTQLAEKQKWSTKIVGQIHDSIVFDFHPAEVDDVLHTAQKVMTERLPRAWKWIKIPLEVDADVGPVDGSWNTTEKYVIQ